LAYDPDLAYVAAAIEQDPSLGKRLSRIQQTDEQLARAFRNVPAPADLQERLLQRLALHDADDANISESEAPQPAATGRPGSHGKRGSYRLLWMSMAAVAASIAAALFFLPPAVQDEATHPEKLLEDAVAFFHADAGLPGTLVSDEAPPAQFAASADVLHIAAARWRKINDFLGKPAVAYDLVGPHGEEATLYVAQRRLARLEFITMPSAVPWLATGGVAATCWQNDDLLYVLVVAGDREQYDAFVRQPGSTIAWIAPAPARIAQAS
jgi:hypothetical protein